jgi:V8-like Glu-specific endopeptidase
MPIGERFVLLALLPLVAASVLATPPTPAGRAAGARAPAQPAAPAPGASGPTHVPVPASTAPPFKWVVELANGCTAALVGRCHVLASAHCVYDPVRRIWWPGTDFFPGRLAGTRPWGGGGTFNLWSHE